MQQHSERSGIGSPHDVGSRSRTAWGSVTAWLIIVVAATVTAVDLIMKGTSVEADSASYLSMAEGLRHVAFTHWSGAPTGLWPYGYPAVLALAGARAHTMIQWAPAVHLAVFVGAAAYLVATARRLAAARPSGAYLVAAAGVLASPALLSAAQWLLAELLFVFAALVFVYHVVIRGLLSSAAPRRLDLVAGAAAAFALPNIRYVGLAIPVGLAAGVIVLVLIGDPDRRVLARRAALPIAAGIAGFVVAVVVNVTTAGTLLGPRVPSSHVFNWVILSSAATFWQTLAGPDHLPLFRYEVAAGSLVAVVLLVLTVATARVAWRHGGESYRRLTVWTLTVVAAYLGILYWGAFTTLVDPISPRFALPVLAIAIMWLVDGYVVASGVANSKSVLTHTIRAARIAGWLAVALWLGAFLVAAGSDIGRPHRHGDLAAIRLGNQDRACLARTQGVPTSARISNNAALVWLDSDGRLQARQASYEVQSPDSFYFIDMRANAVGDVPAALLDGTVSTVVCSGESLVVEQRTHPGR